MFKHALKSTALTLLVFAASCGRPDGANEGISTTKANGVPVGDVRGTALIDKTIKTRMFDATAAGTAGFEVAKIAGFEIYSLKALLGQFAEGTAQTSFKGGEPNPMGLLLWHQVMTRFAQGMAGYCADPSVGAITFFDGSKATLHPAFAAKLKSACLKEEGAEAKLFTAVMGFGAAAEQAPFEALFAGASSEFANASAKDRVEAMFVVMTLNPHFLLEK